MYVSVGGCVRACVYVSVCVGECVRVCVCVCVCVLTALAWLVPHETEAVSAQVLCTPHNRAPCHFMQSHIRKVYACLAVTCHCTFGRMTGIFYVLLW